MARIRTLKPEMWQSESVGRLSREARLLFIAIITQVDDEGRTRASSRGLASLLFPFDDDAGRLIEGWLEELHREFMFLRYEVDGDTYGYIPKWLSHQKIDKASRSKIPAPTEFVCTARESSRGLANPRSVSRIKDLGSEDQGEDQITAASAPDSKNARKAREVFGPKIPTNTGKPWQLPLTTAKRHMTAYGYTEAQLLAQLERIEKHKADLPDDKRPGFGGMHTIIESWLSKHAPQCAANETGPRAPKLDAATLAYAMEVQAQVFPRETA